MKKIKLLLPLVLFSSIVYLVGCSGNPNEGKFEIIDEPYFKMMELVNKETTPAIYSMFTNIDIDTFNEKTDELVSANPELIMQLSDVLAGLCYDPTDPYILNVPIMAQVTRDMSYSLKSFHSNYQKYNLESKFDDAMGIADEIITLEPTVMTDSTKAMKEVLAYSTYILHAFNEGEDLSAYIDAESLIDVIDLVDNLYTKLDVARDDYSITDVKDLPIDALIRSLLNSLNLMSESEINSQIDMIVTMLDTQNVISMENNLAKFLNDNSPEGKLTNYAIQSLYPFIKTDKQVTVGGYGTQHDVFDAGGTNLGKFPKYSIYYDGTDNFGQKVNFIDYGRYILDQEAKIMSKTFTNLSNEKQLFTRQALADLYIDKEKYYRLEDVEIFDFTNQPLMKWLKTTMTDYLNPTFGNGTSNTNGIAKSTFNQLLWSGHNYRAADGTNNGTKGEKYKGLLYNYDYDYSLHTGDPNWKPTYNTAINPQDGYITKMAKYNSVDPVEKPFRKMAYDTLDKNSDGERIQSGTAPDFKHVPVSYNEETIIEALMMNGQLHLYDQYFNKANYQWSWTPEDGKTYFNDENKNLLTLVGGLITGSRNAVVLNRFGYDPSKVTKASVGLSSVQDAVWNMPMITDLLYTMAAAAGYAAPINAPNELSMMNCLKANGSLINDEGCIVMGLPLGMSMRIPVLGAPGVQRKTAGKGWVDFTTMREMPAMETMQPGNYRARIATTYNMNNDDPSDDGFNTTVVDKVEGKFAPQQGDLIGISGNSGELLTGNWALAEIALSCWEGYGPYTYKGKAPNGSECKYQNDWYTDYYKIEKFNYGGYSGWYNSPFADIRTPGVSYRPSGNYDDGNQSNDFSGGADGARYHNYEVIYRPGSKNAAGTIDNVSNSGDIVSGVTVYGYVRHGGINNATKSADYNNLSSVVSNNNKIKLDCATREEAIRKNFYWLFNQKKYQFLIPVHAFAPLGADLPLIGFMHAGSTEIFCFASVNANGISGVSEVKIPEGSSLQTGNAVWSKSGINNNIGKKIKIGNTDDQNYVCNFDQTDEPANTLRFKYTSFLDQDYNITLDYTYYLKVEISIFGLPIDLTPIVGGIVSSIAKLPATTWSCFGPYPVLPKEVGENFMPLITMANDVYKESDILTDVSDRLNPDVNKFIKFYEAYYPNVVKEDPNTHVKSLKVVPQKLPAVPKVKGVSYPVTYDVNGIPTSWETWTNESKGKFDEMVAITGLLAGTIHEDGKIVKSNDGSIVYATAAERESGNFKYFDRDGFRTQFENLVMTMASMNGSFQENVSSKIYTPGYNSEFWLNRLIDFNPVSKTVEPGSRKGLLPHFLNSEYLNINNLDPMMDGIEAAVRHTIRNYFNNFQLSRGSLNNNDNDTDLPEYYVKNAQGDKVDNDYDGYWDISPDVKYNIPLNRLRYFADNRSLDQLADFLDYVKDMSQTSSGELNPEMVDLIYETVKAYNQYMLINDPGFNEIVLKDGSVENLLNFVNGIDARAIIKIVKDLELNDIEKLYNFSFNNFIDENSDPNEVKEQLNTLLSDLNENSVKYLGFSIKEALIDGVFVVQPGHIVESDGVRFNGDDDKNKFIFGKSAWKKTGEGEENSDYSWIDLNDEIGNIYYDIDNEKYVTAMSSGDVANAVTEVVWPGLKFFIDLKYDSNDITYDPDKMSYKDIWYKGGSEKCPNVLLFSNWDLNMPHIMDNLNRVFLKMNNKYFDYDKNNYIGTYNLGMNNQKPYPNYPYLPLINKGELENVENNTSFELDQFSAIDWIYAIAGNSTQTNFTDKNDIFHFAKDYIIYNIYETSLPLDKAIVSDKYGSANGNNLRLTVRDTICDTADLLDKYMYEYTLGGNPHSGYVARPFDENDDLTISGGSDTMHMIDFITQLTATTFNPDMNNKFYDVSKISVTLDPSNPELDTEEERLAEENRRKNMLSGKSIYATDRMFLALKNFISGTDISKEQLGSLKDVLEALLVNDDGSSTRLISSTTQFIPDLLGKFDGNYSELIDLGLLAMAPDGVGTYMIKTLKPADQYTPWNLVDEFCTLVDQDIFQWYNAGDANKYTFWYQLGMMVDQFTDIINEQVKINKPYDASRDYLKYYGNTSIDGRHYVGGRYLSDGFKSMFTK